MYASVSPAEQQLQPPQRQPAVAHADTASGPVAAVAPAAVVAAENTAAVAEPVDEADPEIGHTKSRHVAPPAATYAPRVMRNDH